MAASSASTPMGRPSPESPVASSPDSGIVSSSARRTSGSSGRSPRRPASEPSTGCSSTSGSRASSWPIASGASASGPAARSTCASTRRAACPPRSCSRRSTRPSSRRSSGATARSAQAPRIARSIVAERKTQPITTAEELAALVERVAPGNPRVRRRIHPATRVFQALRIAVNEELEALQDGLAAAVDLLRPGGRLVVLSYHSLEDRIVKRFIAAERRGCVCPPELPVCVCGRNPRLRLVTRPSLTPSAAEIAANPRARSARLRAAERLAA